MQVQRISIRFVERKKKRRLCNQFIQFIQSATMLAACVHIVTAVVGDVAAVGVRETREIPGNNMIKFL